MNTNKIELLAPAGGMDALRAAVRFGANAVYLGGPMLQLRAGNTGFTLEGVREACEYAHARNVRVYVAANAFTFPEEIPDMAEYAKRLKDAGADAMIVSDLGAIRAIKRACPDMEVHVSTQANCTNHESANIYYDLGASRVVLARELNLARISEIRAKTPAGLELEAFVHGAICMAYSGRCLLSTYLTGRSANRGGCAQSCRWKFGLTEEKRPGQVFPIEEDASGTYILSSRDLNAMPLLDEILAAGVTSLKIEGRMKTAYYVATVVNAYRMRLDGADEGLCMEELSAVSHRPYTTGFYRDEAKRAPNAPEGYERTREYLAPVVGRDGDRIVCEVKNKLQEGREVELLHPGRAPVRFVARDLRGEDGAPVSAAAEPGRRFTMPAPGEAGAGDYLRADI